MYLFYNGYIINQEYPLNEKSIENLSNKVKQIANQYLTENNNVYFTIVPDKNYFVDKDNLKLDYNKMENMLEKRLTLNISLGFIIGIIMGLYCKISIAFLYLLIYVIIFIIKLNKSKLTIYRGKNITLQAKVTGGSSKVKWKSNMIIPMK